MEVSFEVGVSVDLGYYLLDFRSAASPSVVEPRAVVAVAELELELVLELVAACGEVAVACGRVD